MTAPVVSGRFPIRLFAASLSIAAILFATSCHQSESALTMSSSANGLQGSIHGGQQPVYGAAIGLYAVGTAGDGSTSTLLASTTSDVNGRFTISAYTCPAQTIPVYLLATGGDPGVGIANPNIALMSMAGTCGNLASSTFVSVNEITTVASVFALAPYIASATQIGYGADLAAFTTAMNQFNELVDFSKGVPGGTGIPSGYGVPFEEINTLANIVASCINSIGLQSGFTTPCSMLFNLTGGSGTTDTVKAILQVAQNPTLNNAALFNLAAPASPFQPSLPTAPAAWVVQVEPMVAAPVISPTPGIYGTSASITMADSTGGATVHYTTDGSIPTLASPAYSGPIAIASNATFQAMASATDLADSAIVSAAYTIAPSGTSSVPTASVPAGAYNTAQTVSLTTSTPGAQIFYTLDGTTPIASVQRAKGNARANGSTGTTSLYTGPISIGTTTTVNSVSSAPGYAPSPVSSQTYTINLNPPGTPTIGSVVGPLPSGTLVSSTGFYFTLACNYCTTIYYTLDGSTPTTSSPQFAQLQPYVTAPGFVTVKAMGAEPGWPNTAVSSANYTLQLPTLTFSPPAGTYVGTQTVTLASNTLTAVNYATASPTIQYTTNGGSTYTTYSAPIQVAASQTVGARIAVGPGFSNPNVTASAAYTITAPPVAATPTFSPAAGTYTTIPSVAISSVTAGASIYYTTDGSTPGTSSTLYTVPVAVGVSETLKAIAAKTGYTNSAVGSSAYTVNLPVAVAPVFSPAGEIPNGNYVAYHSSATITMSSTTAGALIYYTTDGSIPTTSSTLYTAPFNLPYLFGGVSTHLSAIAVKANYTASPVTIEYYNWQ